MARAVSDDAPRDSAGEPTFEAWAAASHDVLRRFAWLVCRDRDSAQDLAQEAMVSVMTRWEQFDGPEAALAYARRCVANGHVSQWRKTRRMRLVPDVAEVARTSSSMGRDPADRVADADLAWRLCEELSAQQRVAVALRFADDLSFAEIGQIMACSEANARSHVHRALKRLRGELASQEAQR